MPARSRLRSCSFALLGAVCTLPPLAAQTHWEFAPYVGLYRPMTFLASDSGDTVKHRSSLALGMRVTKWWPSRWGFEATLGYAPSSLVSSYIYARSPVYSAHVLTVSAQALLRLTPPVARAILHLGAGVSLVGHGGDAYSNTDYTGPRTFLGGIASLGGGVKLGRWLGMRIDVEDFVYSAHLGPCTRMGPGGGSVCDVYSDRSTGYRLQNDLVLSLGVSFVES